MKHSEKAYASLVLCPHCGHDGEMDIIGHETTFHFVKTARQCVKCKKSHLRTYRMDEVLPIKE